MEMPSLESSLVNRGKEKIMYLRIFVECVTVYEARTYRVTKNTQLFKAVVTG